MDVFCTGCSLLSKRISSRRCGSNERTTKMTFDRQGSHSLTYGGIHCQDAVVRDMARSSGEALLEHHFAP